VQQVDRFGLLAFREDQNRTEPFVVIEPGAVLDELIVGQDAVAVRPFFLRVNWG
jgi:hypothetical protein